MKLARRSVLKQTFTYFSLLVDHSNSKYHSKFYQGVREKEWKQALDLVPKNN